MAFAASVGEAILLQFQTYAEQAVVSSGCANGATSARARSDRLNGRAKLGPCCNDAQENGVDAGDTSYDKLLEGLQVGGWARRRWLAAVGAAHEGLRPGG